MSYIIIGTLATIFASRKGILSKVETWINDKFEGDGSEESSFPSFPRRP